jgi:hypothetical protein
MGVSSLEPTVSSEDSISFALAVPTVSTSLTLLSLKINECIRMIRTTVGQVVEINSLLFTKYNSYSLIHIALACPSSLLPVG